MTVSMTSRRSAAIRTAVTVTVAAAFIVTLAGCSTPANSSPGAHPSASVPVTQPAKSDKVTAVSILANGVSFHAPDQPVDNVVFFVTEPQDMIVTLNNAFGSKPTSATYKAGGAQPAGTAYRWGTSAADEFVLSVPADMKDADWHLEVYTSTAVLNGVKITADGQHVGSPVTAEVGKQITVGNGKVRTLGTDYDGWSIAVATSDNQIDLILAPAVLPTAKK
jgi:hypothetical protein